jgi:hypothetical protein
LALTLSLLGLGCGSGSGLGPDGGAGGLGPGAGGVSGGSGGASGASGTTGAAGAPCTTDFAPCGGAVLGTWVIDPRCEPSGQVQSANSCMGETLDFTRVLSQESWVFSADHSMTLTLSAAGPATIAIPDACLAARTPPVTCADSVVGTISFPGGKAGAPSCHDAAGVCTCTLSVDAAPMSGNGTYETAGSTLTIALGTSSLVFDYCATATTLKARVHNSDGGAGVVLLFDKKP